MKVAIFLNELSIGGTPKAACIWGRGLKKRGHQVTVLALQDGPRHAEMEQNGIPARVVEQSAKVVAAALSEFQPDAIHAHAPGYPHEGDVLGEALALLPAKIPVVQTNIFARLHNPSEERFVDFRLFVGWACCVQAARRLYRPLDVNFFRRMSVAVNPLDPDDGPAEGEIRHFREELGVKPGEVLLGQLCRPDPVRWDDIPLRAFRNAQRICKNLKFLIREPPPQVAEMLRNSPDADRFLILPRLPSRPAKNDRGRLGHCFALLQSR